MPTIREATFQLLRELGITTVFGNPGSTEETFLKDFPADFRYVLALQEASAVGIADGFAQVTRRPALVNVHTNAGLSNAMSNIMTAYLNRTPLIVTAGQQTRTMQLLEPWLMNVQPEVLPQPWVKWAYQFVRAEDVPAAFMRAYAVAAQPPAGPVFLSIPLDDWDQETDKIAVVRTVSTRCAPDPTRIADFARRLSEAENPVLIYGASIARADGWGSAIALAERLGAPVWAAPSSERPPFPETHPLYAGGLPFAQGPLSEHLAGHDLGIVVGAPVFRYYPWVPGPYLPDGMELLHITEDPSEAARAPVGESLLSDPVLALDALTGLVSPRTTKAQVTKLPHNMAPHPAAPPSEDDSLLSPRALFDILRELAPADTILTEESPSNLSDLHAAWPVTAPDSFYTAASGSLGWVLPACIGIALGEKEAGRNRRVLAVLGDGSLQYAIQALWTAAHQHLGIIFVVLRNGEYGILKSFAILENTPEVPGLDIPGLDITALATGYGVSAVQARDEQSVRTAFEAALANDGPSLIEVLVQTTVPPLL